VPPPAIDLNTAQLDQTIGVKGQANGGVYQFGVPVAIKYRRRNADAPRDRWAWHSNQFPADRRRQGSDTGDFVLAGNEVNPVIRALRSNGIEVTGSQPHAG
jgi:hypothetical protein